jgi:hypothetical protein
MGEFLEANWGWLVLFVFILMVTNGFGLFSRREKGEWVSIRYENIPAVLPNLEKRNAFIDSDGMSKPVNIEIYYSEIEKKFKYKIWIPEYCLRHASHDLALKELGLK